MIDMYSVPKMAGRSSLSPRHRIELLSKINKMARLVERCLRDEGLAQLSVWKRDVVTTECLIRYRKWRVFREGEAT
jgi:hypothetical protein